ncbi:DUF6603 domain-containing protein [Streptomyces sp. AS02]|uniref:DUF6603 domain-containing protein n=1 Tax=Streptomyces sp. AS02 TaxID=2938946 RepID=UPI002021E29D|nr:DUF6603 domain-containing protein [Streptomyces sp. AS02]MCL8015885.1 hypothetical protein [Streptomyces sp. AS02]
MAGTLELIARELGAALALLRQRVDEGGAAGLLADLGLRPPPVVTAADDAVRALADAAGLADDLAPDLADLTEAIADDDSDAALAAATRLLGTVRKIIAAIATFAETVRRLCADADLTPEQLAEVATVTGQLPARLLDFLVVDRLRTAVPRTAALIELLGLIERVDEPGNPADPLRPAYERRRLRLDRLPVLLTRPEEYARDALGWSPHGVDEVRFLDRIRLFLDEGFGWPALLLTAPGTPAVLEAGLFEMHLIDPDADPKLDVSLRFRGAAQVSRSLPLRGAWSVTTDAAGQFQVGLSARVTPPFQVQLRPPQGSLSVSFAVGLLGARQDPAIVLLGQAGGTRLEARTVTLRFTGTATGDSGSAPEFQPGIAAEVTGGRLVLGLGGADSFLGAFLPGTLEGAADLAADWNPRDGLTVRAGAALEISIPLTVRLGPASLDRLDIGLGIDQDVLSVAARISAGIALGPFAAAVDGVGAAVVITLGQGNLGPANLGLRFLPPRGIGMRVEAGPVTGGGFIEFDEPAGRYSGVLQLKISTFGITALGILDTKLPAGLPGFALLILLRAEFPAIQLGFGIALNGVGGLLGLNRRVDVDALRQSFAAGTVGRILAPEDPVRNAPLLLRELGTVFPVTPGVTVVGPTVQLSWASLVRFDLGIIIELPGPSRIVLLGSARAAIENPSGEGPYLQIRLDILGVLDFARKSLEFDAVLVDSQLLEVFELTGGAAFRLSWGDQPSLVLSIGGFHPAYDPAPLAFPGSLTRVAMSRGRPTDELYLRFEAYFALTTNTVQFGAAVQVVVNAGAITAEGFLGFDALIRFRPFWFEFSFQASVQVKFHGTTLAGVRVTGVLSGPGPVTFTGELCFEILFLEICWNASFTLGSSTPPEAHPITSVLPELGAELRLPSNLVTGGDDPYVGLAPAAEGTPPVLVPLGRLTWEQRRAPLGLLLERFEGAPVEQHETITVASTRPATATRDWYAPGSFTELSESEALNRRGVEELTSGLAWGAGDEAASRPVVHLVEYEQYRTAGQPSKVTGAAMPLWLWSAVDERGGVAEPATVEPTVTAHPETWTVTGADGTTAGAGPPEAQAHQLARANGAVATAAGDRVSTFDF